MIKDVGVSEDKDSGEVLFNFPSKKNIDKVLGTLCDKRFNSVDKLKRVSTKLIMNGSKFFKNKFGLVVNTIKSSSIKELKKDVAKHGPSEIETRGHVFVVWFDSKYCLFKALTDRMLLKHKMVLSVQNFKFYDAVTKDKETLLHECEAEGNETMLDERKVMKLTEREVFGFL